MDVLLISRPGIPLLRSLRESETAWDAIRFYDPVSLSIGVYIPVSTVAGAISLTSDLRFFLRKYTSDYLFRLSPSVYCTSALIKSRYLTRDQDLTNEWPFRLVYWIESMGSVIRFKKEDFKSAEVFFERRDSMDSSGDTTVSSPGTDQIKNSQISEYEVPSGYILEVWCTKPEFELI
jgi:hypothetical protein